MAEERVEKLKYIGIHYGFASQSQILIEEMSELTKAICKFNRADDCCYKIELFKDIEEELADVIIMTSQFLYIWANEKNVENIIDKKIERQLERIKQEVNKCENAQTE